MNGSGRRTRSAQTLEALVGLEDAGWLRLHVWCLKWSGWNDWSPAEVLSLSLNLFLFLCPHELFAIQLSSPDFITLPGWLDPWKEK